MKLTQRERVILEAATKGGVYEVFGGFHITASDAPIKIRYDYRTLPGMAARGLLSRLRNTTFEVTKAGRAALDAGK